MKQILRAFAKNTVFANIIFVMIIFAGVFSASSMIKESFPQFSVDLINIKVVYPGADPEEIEEGISKKIEEVLDSVEGIKRYTTRSSENLASVTIKVLEGFDTSKVLEQVKTRVDSISTFPVLAEKPIISEIIKKKPVMLVSLAGDLSERQLKEWGERIKDEIQQIKGISQVEAYGTRDYEIAIELSEERLRQYGLSIGQVASIVKKSSLNMSGGLLRTSGEEIRIRSLGRKYTGEELANIVVSAGPNGEIITLDRLAIIKDGFKEEPIFSELNGLPAMFVMISKTSQEDAIKISQSVLKFIETKQQQLPPGLEIKSFYDTTDSLHSRINLLSRNGIIGLTLVFVLLWLFLDLRLSFWAGMGIPISISGAMLIMWMLGATINMISLFALIMVLGIVVDDAIVVGEAIYVHRKKGKSPLDAAVDGVSEVALPILAAVTTSIVAFMPLSFVDGMMGKFIAIMPIVVIACLVMSLLECVFLLPAHLSHLPDMNNDKALPGLLGMMSRLRKYFSNGLENFIEQRYKPFLKAVLNYRYISFALAIAILIVSLGLVKGGLVKFRLFPKLDGFIITSTVEFPEGTPPAVTGNALDLIEDAFIRVAARSETTSGEPLIKDKLKLIGQTLSGTMGTPGANLGSVQMVLLKSEQRGIHSNDLLVEWEKEIGSIAGVKSLTFEGMMAGPSGAEIEIWIQGHDMGRLLEVSDFLKNQLTLFKGVQQIRTDYGQGKNELRLTLKPEARGLGITMDDLAFQVYAGFYGREAFRVQRGRDDIRVKVRYPVEERQTFADFANIRIRTNTGNMLPILSVANISFGPGFSTIVRTNGMRRIKVLADVDFRIANANEIFQDLSSTALKEVKSQYPDVYASIQGSKERKRESISSLKNGFPLAILGIFVIIATIFRSYAQPFIILFTIPFGIIGAVVGHLLLGFNLSIMSVFGMVALSGVVINDAIVLIERINNNLAQGMTLHEAIIQGGARRFRAIFLTSISTIGGLAPLILETDMQARFLIPMALSMASGIAFATVLTLLLIPSMFVILSDCRRIFYRLKYGVWSTREELEPRYRKQLVIIQKHSTYER